MLNCRFMVFATTERKMDMSFTSISFMFIFLPVTLVLYGIAARKKNIYFKNSVILFMSSIFYGWCGIQYLLLIYIMVFLNFYGGKKLERCKFKDKKIVLVSIIVIDLLILFICKYFNFFVENIEKIICLFGNANFSFNAPIIPLPLGISFIVFQFISYIVDVYKDGYYEKSLLNFCIYIMLFPQIIEGPIVRYKSVKDALINRESSIEQLENGTK